MISAAFFLFDPSFPFGVFFFLFLSQLGTQADWPRTNETGPSARHVAGVRGGD